MAVRTYDVRSLDDVLVGLDAAPSLEVTVDRGLDARVHPGLFVGDEPGTRDARTRFAEVVGQAQGRPIGTVTFRDVVVLGRGLIAEPATRTLWTGETLGWSEESTAIDLSVWFGAEWRTGRTVEVDEDVLVPAVHLDAAWMALSPGFPVYGHWLIDVAPRLLARQDGYADLPLLIGRPAPWARRLARMLGAPLRDATAVLPRRPVRVDRLVVRTLTKREQAIDRPATGAAWDVLRTALLARAPVDPVPPADRVYVSRAGWQAGRSLVDDDEVEQRVRERGYVVVRPEDLTLRQQAWLFSGARHVVGVDGSGLHNVIHARRDVLLSVVDTHRTNLFHAGVVNVRRQRLAHLAAVGDADQGWRLPVAILDAHLDEVAAAT